MIEMIAVGFVALADRFMLQRNKVEIHNVEYFDNPDSVRFSIDFSLSRTIRTGLITYSLKNKSRPTAVISKTRKLDFSLVGSNCEFLNFDKAELEKEAGEAIQGEWILNIKIERSCSIINPLYKIFPTIVQHSEEFEIR